MAEGEPAEATAEAPPEDQRAFGKMALLSVRGIMLVALLLMAEAVAIFAFVKASGIRASGKKVATSYIEFAKIDAFIPSGNTRDSRTHYQLLPQLEVESEEKVYLEQVIVTDLKPLFIDRIQGLMTQIPTPDAGRQRNQEKLRVELKKEVRAIFNRELLKIEKYQEFYKAEIEKYKEMKRDPRQAHKAEQPGPIRAVVFTLFNF